ncbi:MAG: hypothetical protein MI865_06060, partial [Proteobacteria bacterium]|nr:hypothetical protein [Pseudomonadota bacterium]
LNQHANFFNVDIYITILIWMNMVVTLLSLISIFIPSTESVIGIIILVALVPMGIIQVVFGIKLLKCKADFSSKLKFYAYLNIASGVLLATVILFVFALIASIISDIILAIIFFSEDESEKIEKDGYGVTS